MTTATFFFVRRYEPESEDAADVLRNGGYTPAEDNGCVYRDRESAETAAARMNASGVSGGGWVVEAE